MRSSRQCTPYGRPERIAGDGAILITRTELALLHGLLDRPDGTARSYSAWILAAVPYLTNRTPSTLASLSIAGPYSVPTSWVSRKRSASRVEVTLCERGRDILELRVLCRIRGHGVYRGMRHLRGS